MKIKKEIELSKETYELGQGLAMFVRSIKTATKDGFQYGDDLPDIINSAIRDIVPALDGVTSIGDEYSEDSEVFTQTVLMIGLMIVNEIRKK